MSREASSVGFEAAGLVLAAGESSRMGRDKALLLYQGRTFLETIVAKLRAARIERVAVVLGHHADVIRQAVDLAGVEVVLNREYHRGQTSSLKLGLGALTAATSQAAGAVPEAVFLCLVDHPAFHPDTLRALLAAFERTRAPAVAPTRNGRRGHPVLIGRALFAPLLALTDDQGANEVMRAWRERSECVEVPDDGILMDVDDEAAYRRLERTAAPWCPSTPASKRRGGS